jgi:hypothetical protein
MIIVDILVTIIVDKRDIEREVLCCKSNLYSGSSAGCEDQPYSWVRREGR